MIRKLTSVLVSALLLVAFSASAGDKPSCCAAKGSKAKSQKAAKGEECHQEETASSGKSARCAAVEKKDVAFTGKLLCESCNLKKSDTCSHVFQAEGREGYLPICPDTKDMAGLEKAGREGASVLEVKGVLCKTKDGKEWLMVTSYGTKA